MRDAETTLAISRGCGTVSRSKALIRKDVSTSPRDDPTDGEHGAEGTPRIEPTGEPCATKACAAERGVESLTQSGGARRNAPGSSD
jgi:hypothetical protein